MIVTVNLDSLAISEYNKITGEIFFINENEQEYFPELYWNDMVIILLNWWSKELRSFISGNHSCSEYNFMDGSFSIKLKKTESYWTAFWIEDDVNTKSFIINNVQEFLLSFPKTINSVLRICNKNNWQTEEMILLKDQLKKWQLIKKNLDDLCLFKKV